MTEGSKSMFYFFGRNDKNSYPLHGSEWKLLDEKADDSNCQDDGGSDYTQSEYKCNNMPFEQINQAHIPPEHTMYLSTLKIPGFGIINQNTIGQERAENQFRGKVC